MKNIKDVKLLGKRVLIRVDLNVPLTDKSVSETPDSQRSITDDTRIRAALPTLRYAVEKGARVIVASHLGRPKGKPLPEFSLFPVAERLRKLLGRPVQMAPDCVGQTVQNIVSTLKNGDVVLLENLRFHGGEQKNDEGFAKSLAGLCDIYVNDAFAVSHRKNASVEAVTRFAPVSAAGLLLEKELRYFEKTMTDPNRPLSAIVGGAKVSSKLAALENMMKRVDKILIGGAMANTFLKAGGVFVGSSKVEDDLLPTARDLMKIAGEKGVRFYLPVDVTAAEAFSPDAAHEDVPVQEIPDGKMALDIGPATRILYREALSSSKTIVWNGPMGVFEMDAFCLGTKAMVEAVAQTDAVTIVGGGDTDAAIHRFGNPERFSFISTGGGAFLTLLEGNVLPAVAALEAA